MKNLIFFALGINNRLAFDFSFLSDFHCKFAKMKILLVEDERELHDSVKIYLEREKFVVSSAFTLAEAIDKIHDYEYDCIVLDLMLPDGNGLDLLETLKNSGKKGRVIVLSAKQSLDDKLEGLSLGADDYLTKPFHLAELNARIKTVIRRGTDEQANELELGNLTLSLDLRTARVDQTDLQLNRKEFDILLYFVMNKDRLIRKTALAEHVWGDHIDQADDFDFIYAQIKNVRKKLQNGKAEVEIQSVYGVGYKLILP